MLIGYAIAEKPADEAGATVKSTARGRYEAEPLMG